MDRMIYLSMSGAKAAMQRQDVLANNLANVSTAGFRAELAAFRAVPVLGNGASTRVYALESTVGANHQPGPVQATGRNLDVAMKGNAWLAVQGLDGTEAYTRAGALDVSAEGLLVTKSGLTVLGDGGPITVPANSEVSIAGDGTVSAKAGNGRSASIGRLKLVTPESPAAISRGSDGLFRLPGNASAEASAAVRLAPASLEGSNVNVVEEMVSMISLARQFDLQMKLLENAKQNDSMASKILNING